MPSLQLCLTLDQVCDFRNTNVYRVRGTHLALIWFVWNHLPAHSSTRACTTCVRQCGGVMMAIAMLDTCVGTVSQMYETATLTLPLRLTQHLGRRWSHGLTPSFTSLRAPFSRDSKPGWGCSCFRWGHCSRNACPCTRRQTSSPLRPGLRGQIGSSRPSRA
ncbi:hypothetical protein BD311DRAFT_261516 [Dichomitus squalens]|uniref:Uncharacterized protein n=1 Tax=Dichomitus squalens TaxID=114155 RepID=A0A4Q9MPN8_9APHY|nr:hypothetical protein BD311DRAFT_261516 [Dichomitus squalens]